MKLAKRSKQHKKRLSSVSQKEEKVLNVEPAEQNIDSVFDFLYHDERRVGSFLSQIDPSGRLTAIKQTETANSGSNMKFGARAEAGIVVARGGSAFEDQRTAGEQQSAERSYDPLWTNALTLLDMLDERKMIRDGLESARIGQFVKVSGSLSITDLTLWKGMWSIPALQEMITSGFIASQEAANEHQNRAERRKQGGAARQSKHPITAHAEAAFTVIGMLPHTIQAVIQASGQPAAWCSLREEGLIVSASDLTLKHGVVISGIWTVVGVLDALPDSESDHEAVVHPTGASPMSELMRSLTPAIRGILGRPSEAFGMTPLVIFREVKA